MNNNQPPPENLIHITKEATTPLQPPEKHCDCYKKYPPTKIAGKLVQPHIDCETPEKQCKCHCHTHGMLREECMEYQDCYGKTCQHCQPHQDEGMEWEKELLEDYVSDMLTFWWDNDEFDGNRSEKARKMDDGIYKNTEIAYQASLVDFIKSLLAKDRQQLRKGIDINKLICSECFKNWYECEHTKLPLTQLTKTTIALLSKQKTIK